MSVNNTSGIIIDNSRVMLQIVASLTDDSRGVIYNGMIFIMQATGHNLIPSPRYHNAPTLSLSTITHGVTFLFLSIEKCILP